MEVQVTPRCLLVLHKENMQTSVYEHDMKENILWLILPK